MSNGNGHLSHVQQKMLAVLSDGLPHHRSELHACLWDDQGPIGNIKPHLNMIRKVLRPKGEDIVCIFLHRRICYRHIRLLASATDGKV